MTETEKRPMLEEGPKGPETAADRTADESVPGAGEADLRESVIEAIQGCYDPEIPVNIWELGLIYGLEVADDGKVDVSMTLTSPHCPVAESLPADVERRVRNVSGVSDVNLQVVWHPPWGPEYMSEAAKLTLGME